MKRPRSSGTYEVEIFELVGEQGGEPVLRNQIYYYRDHKLHYTSREWIWVGWKTAMDSMLTVESGPAVVKVRPAKLVGVLHTRLES